MTNTPTPKADKGTGQLSTVPSGNAPASATPQRQLRHLQITLDRLHRHLPPVLLHRGSVFLNHPRKLFGFPLRYRMVRGKKFPPPTQSNIWIIHEQY